MPDVSRSLQTKNMWRQIHIIINRVSRWNRNVVEPPSIIKKFFFIILIKYINYFIIYTVLPEILTLTFYFISDFFFQFI